MKSTILFVDDEPALLASLRRSLRAYREEWDMRFVQSAQEALQEAAERDLDTVVTDVDMPEMDGFALILALRDSPKTADIPIIALTGVGDQSLKQRALALGAVDLLTKPVRREDLVARIRNALRTKSYEDKLKALNASFEQKVKERTAALEQSQREIIWRLGMVSEYRDEETGNHVIRVSLYSRLLAAELGLDHDFTQMICLASPLHDIGKIGIPDKILCKPGELTIGQHKIMEEHAAIGAVILEQYPRNMRSLLAMGAMDLPFSHPGHDNPIIHMAASIARTHHEKWDGSGYPAGLAGERIPIESRIVGLADVYDALRSERPYKPAFDEAKANAIMQEEVGRHFDPEVYAAFTRLADRFQEIIALFADETTPDAQHPPSHSGRPQEHDRPVEPPDRVP